LDRCPMAPTLAGFKHLANIVNIQKCRSYKVKIEWDDKGNA